jgi:hypothetical protein
MVDEPRYALPLASLVVVDQHRMFNPAVPPAGMAAHIGSGYNETRLAGNLFV